MPEHIRGKWAFSAEGVRQAESSARIFPIVREVTLLGLSGKREPAQNPSRKIVHIVNIHTNPALI